MMKLSGKHVVITGGTSGIGFALAKELIARGNEVLAVDFSEENIKQAQLAEPRLLTKKVDLSNPTERVQLVAAIKKDFPAFDVWVNNAGIQRWINLKNATRDWDYYHQELAINFEAPVHLSTLILPEFLKRSAAAIINVSSGLVLTTGAWVPFYNASKNGVHGFTDALRLQVDDTPVEVFELLPPAVDTNLGGSGEHTYGVSLAEFIPAVIEQIEAGKPAITYGTSAEQYAATKAENQAMTQQVWQQFKENPAFKNA